MITFFSKIEILIVYNVLHIFIFAYLCIQYRIIFEYFVTCALQKIFHMYTLCIKNFGKYRRKNKRKREMKRERKRGKNIYHLKPKWKNWNSRAKFKRPCRYVWLGLQSIVVWHEFFLYFTSNSNPRSHSCLEN